MIDETNPHYTFAKYRESIGLSNLNNVNFELPHIEFKKFETKQETTIMGDKKELPELIKGKILEPVDVPISTLAECLRALADGYVLESVNGFSFLMDDKLSVAKYNGEFSHYALFSLEKYIAAYKLVDVPWWENIPDGGVLCKHLNGAYCVVTDVKEEGGYMFAVVQNRSAWAYLKDFEPVTDEWLESIKCGF